MVETGSKPLVWIVVPCFNEHDALPRMAPIFLEKVQSLARSGLVSDKSRICFVDDGSNDDTWQIIETLARSDEHYLGLALSRNRGHQNALLCGLMEARGNCDAAISADCDGQDDLDAIDEMIGEFLAGSDIVYGVREDRSTDTAFKRKTAEIFYGLMNRFGAETVYNHADYRLMSERALDALAECGEVNLFLRGIVPFIGFPSSIVRYSRKERVAGESHYSLRKMISLAINGITSCSIRPLRIVSGLGLVFSLVGLAGIVWALVSVIVGSTVVGWASTVIIVCLIGGIQLLSLGVLGEYVGRIYLESKRRPRYFVSERTWVERNRLYRG